MSNKSVQRRNFNRIKAALIAKFTCGNKVCSGHVTNLSETGMYIHADIKFPFDSMFEVDISLKEKSLKVPVKVSRLVKRGKNYETMAVEVIKPHEKYLEFINSLKHTNKYKKNSANRHHNSH